MSNRGSDSDKLNPTHVSSSRAPLHLGHTGRPPHHHLHHHAALHDNQAQDDDDKLLDVVGPPQSPLLPLSHSLQQMHAHQHSGRSKEIIFIYLQHLNESQTNCSLNELRRNSWGCHLILSFICHNIFTTIFLTNVKPLQLGSTTWPVPAIMRTRRHYAVACNLMKWNAMAATRAVPKVLVAAQVAPFVPPHRAALKKALLAWMPLALAIRHQIYPWDHRYTRHHICCLASTRMVYIRHIISDCYTIQQWIQAGLIQDCYSMLSSHWPLNILHSSVTIREVDTHLFHHCKDSRDIAFHRTAYPVVWDLPLMPSHPARIAIVVVRQMVQDLPAPQAA